MTARLDVVRDRPGPLVKGSSTFQALIEGISDVVAILRWDGVIAYVSPSVESIGGYRPQDLVGTSWFEILHADSRSLSLAAMEKLKSNPGGAVRSVLRCRHRDGRWMTMETSSRDLTADPAIRGVVVTLRDVTEREQQRASLQRLHRTLEVLSAINGLIVRARTQGELFQDAVRIAVERGGFAGACVALLRGDALVPVATLGLPAGGLDRLLQGSWARGLAAGTAMPARVCHTVKGDLDFGGMDAGNEHVKACMALPLLVGNRPEGLLCFCAPENGSFSPEEEDILRELAANLGYALEFITQEQRLDYLAIYDPLTKLANRRLFVRRLRQFLAAAGESAAPLTVAMFDIADFKALNDALGRDAGDQVLVAVAERLKQFAGGPSFAARLGGDSFALVLPGLAEGGVARVLGSEAWSVLTAPYPLGDCRRHVAGVFGSCSWEGGAADAEALLANAELALKHAKSRRETLVRYRPELRAAAERRMRLEQELRGALPRGEFAVVYQPKVELRSGVVTGAEALLRWNSPVLGCVDPSEFVPLLEGNGFIDPVGSWVIEQVLRDRARWAAAGLRAVPVAVNVSPVQLQRPDFVATVSGLLAGTGGVDLEVTETGLDLEISEAGVKDDLEGIGRRLRELCSLGVRIAIDDFGTGYSSLSMLPRLPLHALKIDRAFVSQMTESSEALALVSTMLALARALGLKVVAEGVETAEQVKFLRLLNCDEYQGHWYSPALPGDHFLDLLRAEGGPGPSAESR